LIVSQVHSWWVSFRSWAKLISLFKFPANL
jgi:hypothetical protein